MAKYDKNFGKVYNKKEGRYETDAEKLRRMNNFSKAMKISEKAEMYEEAGKKKESKDAYMGAGKAFENAGDFWDAARMYNKGGLTRRKAYQIAGRGYEDMRDFNDAAKMYKKAGMKKEACIAEGRAYETYKQYWDAARMYRMAGTKEGEIMAKNVEMKKRKASGKTIDNVVTSILAFGGLGLIFTLFSKPYVVGQNVQLAPPFPNYMIYVFAAMLLGAAIYLTVKKIKK